MSDVYDVAVVGLGAIGSATAAELARRGHRVLGLDRWGPPHAMGSHHGGSRMLREAWYEGSECLPLVRATRRRWKEIEERSGRSLLVTAGGLMIGPPGSGVFGGGPEAAADREYPCETLPASEAARRFPAFRFGEEETALYEPAAGILRPEACIEVFHDLAAAAGAELRACERLREWRVERGTVRLGTGAGERRARRMVLTAGAWMRGLAGGIGLPLVAERTVQFWFEPREGAGASRLSAPSCPMWVWEHEPGSEWYGVPLDGGALKVGIHRLAGRETDPETIDRHVSDDEIVEMRAILERLLPDAAGGCRTATVCMYANTPDRRFVLDRHPRHAEIALFAGGSGHAFKFAPVIGDLLADLTEDADPPIDLSPFRIGRF